MACLGADRIAAPAARDVAGLAASASCVLAGGASRAAAALSVRLCAVGLGMFGAAAAGHRFVLAPGKTKQPPTTSARFWIAVRCLVRRSVLAPVKQSGRRLARLLWLARLRQLAPALLWARGTPPPVRPTRHSAGVAARTILRRGLVWHATQSVFDATAAVCPASAFRHTPRGPT